MTKAEALDVYRVWLEALNNRDWDRFAECLAPDARFVFTHRLPADEGTLRGRAEIVANFMSWQSRFTRFPGEIVDTICENDRCAIQIRWSGDTVDGSEVVFASCHMVTVQEGRLAEIVDFFDQKTYDQQVAI